ncbi:endolytic transglycosylase MltG [Mechercharimyces sp. CAU 1602]|uniref:endolytic transglycosylase MltG n=1 Tax=Mechercharimyces sp. CAU 1602 TaxID=2973933 RepID=UPI002163A8A8|nr:endolytic transglycosylase MltG [Mechercharimyces sp. CAU 1602]MCS1350266.1 endolytic transglycosylase MltG [Mechercharimyces sp. CAU 1602]
MKWVIRLLLLVILLASWLILLYLYVDHTLGAPPRSESMLLEIPAGSSNEEIGSILKQHQLIRDDLFFRPYTYVKGNARGLKAGVYEIPADADLEKVLEILTAGKESSQSITIPEGYTVEQMADKVKELGIERDEFLMEVNKRDYDFTFVDQIPDSKEREYVLEGYLYPSTYYLPKNEISARKLIEMMLTQFNQHLKENEVALQKREISVDEWVRIASITEKETMVEAEFPMVTGVIFNRLQSGKLLQVDATIQYALRDTKARLTYDDLKVESPYNTYKHEGLPPGPISNPGKVALEAAANPKKHDYIYYVTKKDGTQEHYFARTYDEHLQNKSKSEKNAANTTSSNE